MSLYRVKSHHWIDGALETIEHMFDSRVEAIEQAESSTARTNKVYDEKGQMIHNVNGFKHHHHHHSYA